ncbi:hypothetical protein NM688_g3822 [Phlebia brevispora]|uniref:Uncharacterized protein n=1 Tax=Phlebia brevispora TaxID=194682 RepID=A0ACC1T4R5_9APHY|nr:hypothetical protein NM688_g3822 [Phlebia brevispora]
MYPGQRPRPDRDHSRLAWENSWAQDLDEFYSPQRPLSSYRRFVDLPISKPLLETVDTEITRQHRMVREICDLQTELVHAVVNKWTNDDFEKKWKRADEGRRKDVILEGIVRACKCVDWMESKRGLCPDITLRVLSSSNGDGYLQVLRKIMPHTPPSSSFVIIEPIHVPHPIIDHMLHLTDIESQQAGYRVWTRTSQLSRTYFITMTVWNIFLTFYGEVEEYATAKVGDKPNKDVRDALRRAYGKREYRTLAKELKEARKEQHRACWRCGKPENSPSLNGQRLQSCSKCSKIGRQVLYCSRDCQVQDWKNGIPRPHRDICGKTSLAGAAAESSSASASHTLRAEDQLAAGCVPEPDPKFKRSPALLHQLSFLQQPPYVDYTIIFPHPDPDQGVMIPMPEEKVLFLSARTRALRTGDPRAVRIMYDLLKPWAARLSVSESKLQAQLEREFEIVLDGGKHEPDDAFIDSLLSPPEEERKAIAISIDAAAGKRGSELS